MNYTNKKYLLTILGILFLAMAVSYSYYIFHKPLPDIEIKDSPFSVLLQNSTDTLAESTGWYDTKIVYPVDNTKVRDQIFQIYSDYVKETQIKNYSNLADAKTGLQINVDGEQYQFDADYKIATSTDTITYIYEIYTFTGGAHGSTQIVPITEDANQQIIPVTTILPDNSLQKVSVLAKAEILKQKHDRMETYGNMTEKEIADALATDQFVDEGVAPNRDNYSSVWYEGDNIVISFGQYQVGPYVDGIYTVKIPKSSIAN